MWEDMKGDPVVCGTLRGQFRRHILRGFSIVLSEEEKTISFKNGSWGDVPWDKPDGKKGSGLGELLDAALAVAGTPTDKAVKDFAALWGPLTKESGNEEPVFPLGEYKKLCLKSDAFLRLYAGVSHGMVPEKTKAFDLEESVDNLNEEYVKEYIARDMDKSDSPDEMEDFSLELNPWMMLLRHLLRTWWRSAAIKEEKAFIWVKEENEYRLDPFSRFESYGCKPAIYMDLYRHVLGNSRIFLCDRCGKVYVRDVRRPNENARNFCPDCNVGYRTTQSINFRRWKERKEMEEFFSNEGIAFETKQVELPYRGFIAEKIAAVPEFREMRVGEVSLWREEGKEVYFLLACPDPEKVSEEKLSKTLGKEVVRVESQKAEELFPGRDFGLPPFPMQKRRQYPLIIDRKLLGTGKVVLPTGFRSYFLVFEASDLERSSRVKVVDF